MLRKLSFPIPSPALAFALAVVLVACGGLAMAASSSKTKAIRACASKQTGALRLANKCRRSERSLSWNQTGPKGLQGLPGRDVVGARGDTGAPGVQGQQGPLGPGATSLQTTIAAGGNSTLASLPNGVTVSGSCGGGVHVSIAGGGTDLRASGTASFDGTVQAVDLNGTGTFTEPGANNVDLDVVASAGSAQLARIDVHGSAGTPCVFWGVIVPSG